MVGAGPAGSMAALHLARASRRVLLLDKARFPRPKVCGCCLNAASLAALERADLGHLPERLGAVPLARARVACGSASANVPLPGGAALSREAFDAALVTEAIRAGAAFLPETTPTVGTTPGHVRLRSGARASDTRAKTLVAADGLAGRTLGPEHGFTTAVAPQARIGCGVILEDAPGAYEPAVIHMACAAGGYVGAVRLEDGRLDVAAAFDPAFVRKRAGPGPAAAAIIESCGFPPIPALEHAEWRGTRALTRRRTRLQRAHLFAIGDAASYVEPFTGEGIAWALAGAAAVVPHVIDAIARPSADMERDTWTAAHRSLLARRQRSCRAIAWALRRPRLTHLAIRAAAAAPVLTAPLLTAINRTPRASPRITA